MAGVTKNTNGKWWQLFKTGKHTAASGEEFAADKDKIEQIINATKNHVYANDEVPICIGHKKENSPKWGAFKKESFKRAGDYLIGSYDYLVTEFAEYINRKMFDKVSIALYPDLAIKHIALLGVQAPAIKDLAPVELNEPQDTGEIPFEIEFNEFGECEDNSRYAVISGIIKNIKKFIVEKYSPAEAEKAIPECNLSDLIRFPGMAELNFNSFTESTTNINKEQNMPGKTTQQVPQDISEKLSEYEKQIAELKEKLLESEIKEFCESPEMVNKITPALLQHVKCVYTELTLDNTELEFSEGEGENKTTYKTTRLDSFKKILSALPSAVEFREHATKENAAEPGEPDGLYEFNEMNVNSDSLELHRKALKIQSAERCSYVEAVKKASRQ